MLFVGPPNAAKHASHKLPVKAPYVRLTALADAARP
jgi:hypothetical protein